MKTRQELIDFDRKYCEHYTRGKGADMVCTAGVNLRELKKVPSGPDQIKWGPCIYGDALENPLAHCPHWKQRTLEHAEQRADEILAGMKRMEVVTPVVYKWRLKSPFGKAEVIECPVCKGKLHLSQSSHNGHVHGACETQDCVRWME